MHHVVTFDVPVEAIYEQLTAEDYWRTLSEEYRGLNPPTQLTEFTSDAHGTDIELRHVQFRDDLPPIARNVFKSDLAVTRRQHFEPFVPQQRRAAGTFTVTMPKGRLSGDYELAATEEGSEFRVNCLCKLSIPLVGGVLEEMILSNLGHIFDRERTFTADRLTKQR
jgi:Protein of unknown function (DUF2505)